MMANEVASSPASDTLRSKLESSSICEEQSLTQEETDDQIKHVLNRDKSYQNEHGQKLFNAINCLLDDEEQLELTQALFKYQSEYNVFTLVRSCCEIFDTPRKKSLMLFMRPVIPVKDRFHYDEYYKLFFPEEFAPGITSIFCDLIPKDLLDKTMKKVQEKKMMTLEREKEFEAAECLNAIKLLEKVNSELNMDIQKLMSNSGQEATSMLSANPSNIQMKRIDEILKGDENGEGNSVQIAGFRIIEIAPAEDESLGFDVCMGPTGTFIMISYVEPGSLVEKLGMKPGDELVSVNETSFKMITLDQAVDVLSSEPNMRIVLQTSGFMPEFIDESPGVDPSGVYFDNQWLNPFGKPTQPPSECKNTLKRLIRRLKILPKSSKGLGLHIRGGIEFSLGIFVSRVDPMSDAALAGLRPGDQIIEVNGQIFSRISQADAVKAFKQSFINYLSNKAPIKLTVRYLGKLPLLLKKKSEPLATVQEVALDLEDSSSDSEIYLHEDLKKLTITKNILHEDDLMNHDLIQSKLNIHSDEVSTVETTKKLDSLKIHFDSKHDFNLFRYYLNDYLNCRINIKYFLFLITNRILRSVKKLIDSHQLQCLIKVNDIHVLESFLESRKELAKLDMEQKNDVSSSYVYLMCDEYKKRLLTRSYECLGTETTTGDLINGSLVNKSFYKSLDNLVEIN